MPYENPFVVISSSVLDNALTTTHGWIENDPVEKSPSPETKTVLKRCNGWMALSTFSKDGRFCGRFNIMPAIQDVHVYDGKDGKPAAIRIDFADGTHTTAVRQGDDVFSLEQGVAVCISKRLLEDLSGGYGNSLYNKLIHYACKVYEDSRKEEEAWATIATENKRRLKKLAEKKRKRDERKAAKAREEQINIQKEAILRAMKEYNITADDLK